MTGERARRPRESYAERRSRRDAIDDPEVVLAAAFRFLEARARSVAETRRRLQRAYALLARNGFSPDVCSTVAKRALAASAEDAIDDGLGEDDE